MRLLGLALLPLLAGCVPAVGPLAQGQPASPGDFFPLGVYDHAGVTPITQMVPDLKARGLDTVMFVHNFPDHDWWDYTDKENFNVIYGAGLYDAWFKPTVNPPLTLDSAKRLLAPHVENIRDHPSVRAVSLADEPGTANNGVRKLELMVQALRALDPGRPSTAVLISPNNGNQHIRVAQPDVTTLDVYPFHTSNAPCDDTMRGFGLPADWDFVRYVRHLLNNPEAPKRRLWMILQAHSFAAGDPTFALRVPQVPELRMQQWLAVGEGAKGLIWFFYSPKIDVIEGLANPKHAAQYAEVSRLSRRIAPLRPTLLGLDKQIRGHDSRGVLYAERFSVTGGTRPYVSTLEGGGRDYAVAVNRDCAPRQMTLSSLGGSRAGSFKNLETGAVVRQGEAFLLDAGDGAVFEFVPN